MAAQLIDRRACPVGSHSSDFRNARKSPIWSGSNRN
jgi:hypothetical protein